MILNRFRLFIVAGVLGALTLGAAAQDTTVNLAFVESQPNTLDPHAARTVDEFLVMRNVCEGLVNYDPSTLKAIPALAESWTISDDGLVYTFRLRQGVTFFDGSTLDAADVKYSLDRLANPAFGTSYTAGLVLRDVAGWAEARPANPRVGEGTPTPSPIPPAAEISGLQVVDDATVQITLSRPVTSFITRLTLPGAVVLAENSSAAGFGNGPVCAGPYRVVEFVQNDRVVLRAHAGYWGGVPEVQSAIIRVIPEASSQVIEFEAGLLDVSVAPEADLPRLRADAVLAQRLVTIPTLGLYNLRMNLNDPKIGDVRVRRALALAVDRQLIVNTVLQG